MIMSFPATDSDSVLVVLPAHNESTLVGRAIAAVQTAARVSSKHGIGTVIVVVADSCDDDTAEVARTAGAEVLESNWGAVGAARDAGVRYGLQLLTAPTRAIVMSSDADSVVAPTWIQDHVSLHRQGAEIVLGTVTLEPGTAPDAVLQEWRRNYLADSERAALSGHGHIHGANLSVRADIYLASGGFLPLLEHEDRELVAAIRADGASVVWTELSPVLTSARVNGRTPGGVAQDITQLSNEISHM